MTSNLLFALFKATVCKSFNDSGINLQGYRTGENVYLHRAECERVLLMQINVIKWLYIEFCIFEYNVLFILVYQNVHSS